MWKLWRWNICFFLYGESTPCFTVVHPLPYTPLLCCPTNKHGSWDFSLISSTPNWDSIVNAVTSYRFNNLGRSGQQIFFCSPQIPDWLWINGYQDSFPRVKWPEHEADHSPPSSAETKNDWICISTPPVCFKGWTGIILPWPLHLFF